MICDSSFGSIIKETTMSCSTCSKCGSDNILIRHIPEGAMINGSSRHEVETEFVASSEYEFFWKLTAKKEHLSKHCRCCQYGWREDVISGGAAP